jgi:hypothetical protein
LNSKRENLLECEIESEEKKGRKPQINRVEDDISRQEFLSQEPDVLRVEGDPTWSEKPRTSLHHTKKERVVKEKWQPLSRSSESESNQKLSKNLEENSFASSHFRK